MRAIDRLNKLKQEIQNDITIEKFVSLTNPKNVSLMQALVAWQCSNVKFDEQYEVQSNASMDELWTLSSIDTREFSDTAGISVMEGISKLRQMRNLGLIYPNGTICQKAKAIVKVYVKGKIEGLQ